MVLAKVELTEYGIKDIRINFYGDIQITSVLSDLIRLRVLYKYILNTLKITVFKKDQEKLIAEKKELVTSVAKLQSETKFWLFNREVRNKVDDLRIQIDGIDFKLNKLSNKIQALKDDSYYDFYEKKQKYYNLLSTLGFSNKGSTNKGTTTIEDYEFCGDEKELLEKVREMYNELAEALEYEKAKIKKEYNKSNLENLIK